MGDAAVESIFLHQDIITEILLRLPIKSLLRFRTVHKSWNALMKIPRFDSLRRKLPVLVGGSMGRMLVYTLQNNSGLLVIRNIYLHGMELKLPYELRDIFKFSIARLNRILIMGPYNGVYLVYDRWGNYVLWNHATRDYKVLSQMYTSSLSHPVICGFGFDELSDGVDFLIVRVHLKRTAIWSHNAERLPELYKSSSGVWKNLKMPFPKKSWVCYSTEYINKVFYWLGRDRHIYHYQYYLVSFDMTTEIFEEIDLPVSVETRDILFSSYVSSDGNKFLSLLELKGDILNVWVLKEQLGPVGVGKSWFRAETLSKKYSNGGEGIGLAEYMPSAIVQYDESLVSLRE